MICKITFVEGRGRSDIGTGSGVCFILFSARQHPNDDHTPNLGSHMVSALFWLKWQSPRLAIGIHFMWISVWEYDTKLHNWVPISKLESYGG